MQTAQSDLSWRDVERLAGTLAAHIPAATGVAHFDRVVGVSRGGLVPAVLVAGLLEVQRVASVQVRFYDGGTRLDAPVLVGEAPAPAGPSGDPACTLVVDEILDSGATMRFLHDLLPQAALATLVARQTGARVGEVRDGLRVYRCGEDGRARVWAATALATTEWILFPWSPAEDRAARRERR